MPQPPGIIDRVNYVINKWEYTCEAPWTVYIETALPAALEMFIFLVEPSADEILENYLQPRQRRSTRHGRPGSRSRRRRLGIPDLDEMIGNNLPFAERVQTRPISNGVAHLWRVFGVIERGLWYWMVADAATLFLYNWTSLLYTSEKCSQAGTVAALFEDDGPEVAAIQGWQEVDIQNATYNNGVTQTGANVLVVPDASTTVTLSCTIESRAGDTQQQQIGLFRDGLFKEPLALGAPATVPAGGTADHNVTATVPAGQQVVCGQRCSFQNQAPIDTACYVQGRK